MFIVEILLIPHIGGTGSYAASTVGLPAGRVELVLSLAAE